jgi:hypothetical protein
VLTGGAAHAQLPLPLQWTSQDIGNVGVQGSASRDSTGDEESTWSVSGSGSDIWGTSDSFFFAYQYVGDAGIFATPNWPENTNEHAKAGIMIRQSTDPASAFVIVDFQPDGSVEFMTRPSTGAETQFIAGLPPGSRGFLGLSRNGTTVTASFCAATCQLLGSVPFPDGVALMGLAVTSHDNGVLNHATFSGEPNLLKLPAPWRSFDVGATPSDHVGDAYFMHDTFTVIGYGADIWGTADEYRAVTTAFRGDGYVRARVTQEQADNTFAKAGVAIVNDSGNATVILDVRPNGLIEFMARPVNGAPMAFIAGAAASFPVWLKLQRTGDQFTGSISQDGQTWQVVGSTTVRMEFPDARLVVTSHDRSQPNTSTFDHVVAASHLLADTDVGDVGKSGCVCLFSGDGNTRTYLQEGSGANIWGTQDAFNFDYRLLLDDQRIVAKLQKFPADTGASVDTFAKAGVMIRESLDPASPFVILDVRPGGEIEFMARTVAGAETMFISGGTTTVPVMLRLTRDGSMILGETSLDGTNWNTIGTANVNFSAEPLAGTVVTSRQRGILTSADFEEPVLR